ncbi:MAG: hypothetical protein Q7S09_01615 [bacterium]|nr:hypothetical protein [bacterium]
MNTKRKEFSIVELFEVVRGIDAEKFLQAFKDADFRVFSRGSEVRSVELKLNQSNGRFRRAEVAPSLPQPTLTIEATGKAVRSTRHEGFWLAQVAADVRGNPLNYVRTTEDGRELFRTAASAVVVVTAQITETDDITVTLNTVTVLPDGREFFRLDENPRTRLFSQEMLDSAKNRVHLEKVLSAKFDGKDFEKYGNALVAAVQKLAGIDVNSRSEQKDAPATKPAPISDANANANSNTDTPGATPLKPPQKKAFIPPASLVPKLLEELYGLSRGGLKPLRLDQATVIADLQARALRLGDYNLGLKELFAEYPTTEALGAKYGNPGTQAETPETGRENRSASSDDEFRRIKTKLVDHYGKPYPGIGTHANSIAKEIRNGGNEEEIFKSLNSSPQKDMESRDLKPPSAKTNNNSSTGSNHEEPHGTAMADALQEAGLVVEGPLENALPAAEPTDQTSSTEEDPEIARKKELNLRKKMKLHDWQEPLRLDLDIPRATLSRMFKNVGKGVPSRETLVSKGIAEGVAEYVLSVLRANSIIQDAPVPVTPETPGNAETASAN